MKQTMPPITLLIPAAGQSSRMGGADKLLQMVDGTSCLRTLAMRGLAAGANVVVLLNTLGGPRHAALDGLNITTITVPDAAFGMAHTLRAGIQALPPGTAGAMILPADMPEITAQDIRALIDDFLTGPPCPALRASTADGLPGHPIIFAPEMFDKFAQLSGDKGANSLLGPLTHQIRLHPLTGNRARLDLDSPEEWAAWQQAQQPK